MNRFLSHHAQADDEFRQCVQPHPKPYPPSLICQCSRRQWRVCCLQRAIGDGDAVVWDKTCVMNVHKINYATNGDPLSCPHMCVLHMSMEQLLTVNGILGNEKKAWQCCSITTLSHLAVALTSACVGGCQTNSGTALANPWATGLVCEDRLQTVWTEQPPFQCSGSRAPSYPAGCSQEPSEAAL